MCCRYIPLGSRRRISAHNFWDPGSHSEWLRGLFSFSRHPLCKLLTSLLLIHCPHPQPPSSQYIFMFLFNSALPCTLHNVSVNSTIQRASSKLCLTCSPSVFIWHVSVRKTQTTSDTCLSSNARTQRKMSENT